MSTFDVNYEHTSVDIQNNMPVITTLNSTTLKRTKIISSHDLASNRLLAAFLRGSVEVDSDAPLEKEAVDPLSLLG